MMTRTQSNSEASIQKLLGRLLSTSPKEDSGWKLFAFLLAGNGFLVMVAYYLLKTVREALILAEGGAEMKSYAAAAQALLLLFLVPAFGTIASKVNGVQLTRGVSVFFVASLLGLFSLGVSGARVGQAFFLWVGIFNVFVVALFWGFAADLCNEREGKRMFPILGLGGTLGGWAGAWFASQLFPVLGSYGLMLFAAVLLSCSVPFLGWASQARSANSGGFTPAPVQEPPGEEGRHPLLRGKRYLWLIAVLILLVNVVNSTGEYMLGKMVAKEAERVVGLAGDGEILRRAFIGQFYATFYGWVNLLGVLFQVLLASRIFKRVSVPATLFILPTLALAGYGLLAAAPGLGFLLVAKVLENSTGYSIQNTARQALFLSTTRETKYTAKVTIDSFGSRGGDLLHAGVVFLGSRLAFDLSTYACINVVFIVAWMIVVAALYRETQGSRTKPQREARAAVPRSERIQARFSALLPAVHGTAF